MRLPLTCSRVLCSVWANAIRWLLGTRMRLRPFRSRRTIRSLGISCLSSSLGTRIILDGMISLGFCNKAHLSTGKGFGLVDMVCNGWFIVRWHSVEGWSNGEGNSVIRSSFSSSDTSNWLAVSLSWLTFWLVRGTLPFLLTSCCSHFSWCDTCKSVVLVRHAPSHKSIDGIYVSVSTYPCGSWVANY